MDTDQQGRWQQAVGRFISHRLPHLRLVTDDAQSSDVGVCDKEVFDDAGDGLRLLHFGHVDDDLDD